MARRARIEYPGAIYHVINRGNYRSDVFGSAGAAEAFVKVLEEAVGMFGWRLGAYAVMRNHFHLAVQTPEPNLAAGMQWLQVTFAARFNRLRAETGHLFQGRYKAILLQNEGVWARVANYIHLNPVRAGIVTLDLVMDFRWSSWSRFANNRRFKGLDPQPWLATLGLEDGETGWRDYATQLRGKLEDDSARVDEERSVLSSGWAVGSNEWKIALIQNLPSREPSGLRAEYVEPKDAMRLRWQAKLEEHLRDAERTQAEIESAGKGADWKVEIALRLQQELGASVVWLAETLSLGKPASARVYLYRARRNKFTIHDMTPSKRPESGGGSESGDSDAPAVGTGIFGRVIT